MPRSPLPATQPASPIAPGQPLLTIAIPTFNRAPFLAELLSALEPQLPQHPDVEVLIADNSSSDTTPALVAALQHRYPTLPIRSLRHPENIGSDRNFISCFEHARGRYLWIVGDDDILIPDSAHGPGALAQLLPHLRAADFDLVYATSSGFRRSWQAEHRRDPLHRRAHVLRSARQFTRVANIMVTFISGMVVNRERLLALRAADSSLPSPTALLGTHLTQLSWTLPFLQHHRQSLVLWDRPVAGRQGNTSGYSLGEVFGTGLLQAARLCLPRRPDLVHILARITVRRWLPSQVLALRSGNAPAAAMLHGQHLLRQTYGRLPGFWFFTAPVLRLPLPLARLWHRATAPLAQLLHILEVPSILRRSRP